MRENYRVLSGNWVAHKHSYECAQLNFVLRCCIKYMLLPLKSSVPQVINAMNMTYLILIPATLSNKYKAIICCIGTSSIK